jgi:hypothetical protein
MVFGGASLAPMGTVVFTLRAGGNAGAGFCGSGGMEAGMFGGSGGMEAGMFGGSGGARLGGASRWPQVTQNRRLRGLR